MRIPTPILYLGCKPFARKRVPVARALPGVPWAAALGGAGTRFLFLRKLLPLLALALWTASPPRGNAALPALRIEFAQAVQVLNHSLDPRSHNLWGPQTKPVPGAEHPWMARYAFNAERVRAILTEVYHKGPLRLGNSGSALVVIEAGRTTGVAEIDLMVPSAVFLELQRTLKAPQGVRLLFPDPQGFKDEYRVNIRYENR